MKKIKNKHTSVIFLFGKIQFIHKHLGYLTDIIKYTIKIEEKIITIYLGKLYSF